MTDSVWFIYPGQPFIEEGIVSALLAFLKDPRTDGESSVAEKVNAARSVASTMIAVESLKNHALHLNNKREDQSSLIKTLANMLKEGEHASNFTKGLNLWEELRMLRNGLVHAHLFFDSSTKSEVSGNTRAFLEREIERGKLDGETNETKLWALTVNPLRVSRYEALVALTLFYWIGTSTTVWQHGNPFMAASTDRRLKDVYDAEWFTNKKFHKLLRHTGEMKYFLGYLGHRLSAVRKELYFKNVNTLLDERLEESGRMVIDNPEFFGG